MICDTMATSVFKTLTSASSSTATKLRLTAALASNPDLSCCCNRVGPLSASSSPFSTATSAAADPLSFHPPEQRTQWSKWMLFLPGVITFGLGTWQIVRRQEKIKMLQYRQQRLATEPVKWNNLSSSQQIDSLEFRKILCKGVFDEKRSIFVGPRSRSVSGVTENGYFLITPLMPIPNDPESIQTPVLVNRGWVPRSWRDRSINAPKSNEPPSKLVSVSGPEEVRSWWSFFSKKQKTIEEQVPDLASVEVIGVIRKSEKPSIFVPPNDPSSFQWFYVDVPAIARACGLPDSTLYIEDINENVNPSSPYPIPKDANTLIRSSVMPQDHLNYTITWYSLSAAVTYMAFKRLKPTKMRR
uniref:SURF1-like protein n=1 Tax=Kalanchoe fedtschenkoi TaxID=63787 RepID=A0A7N1A807_KALFE